MCGKFAVRNAVMTTYAICDLRTIGLGICDNDATCGMRNEPRMCSMRCDESYEVFCCVRLFRDMGQGIAKWGLGRRKGLSFSAISGIRCPACGNRICL